VTTFEDADRTRIDAIPLSHLGDHARTCCAEARQLLLARVRNHDDVGSRLAAVPTVIRWGPTRWPAAWCDLASPGDITGDCGVHAEVAATLLADAGVTHTRGRAAIRPAPFAVDHWRVGWEEAGVRDDWIGARAHHHEVLRIGDRWWDPTEARWFSGAGASLAAGLVIAVREETGEWQLAPR
jgi:hypothetical protein